MSLDADLIVDRRRMRRKLTFWRVFAVLILIGAVVAVAASVRRGDVLTAGGDYIARVKITGPHPQRSGSRGLAREAGEVERQGGDRADR